MVPGVGGSADTKKTKTHLLGFSEDRCEVDKSDRV